MLITIAIILAVGVLAFTFLFRTISMTRTAEIASLDKKIKGMKSKYAFMRDQLRDLKKELEEAEHKLATQRNSQEGIKTFSARELDIEESGDAADEKVSRYLVQEGKITLEQNEKILKKMETLQMDFLGTCLTLGFIDIDTAKKTMKINKVASKLSASS